MSLVPVSKSSALFPDRDEKVRGEWMPLFIEPVVGSGERICIGVAAANESGSVVVQVPALHRLQCIYGTGVKALLTASEYCLDDLRQALRSRGASALRQWQPPMEGMYRQSPVVSAGASLEVIARDGLTLSASLVDRLSETEDETEQAGDRSISGTRLEQLVKQQVVAVRPGLEPAFARERKLRANVRPAVIGFVGNVIAANFGVLVPHKLSEHVRDIKAKLWDLAQLREDFGGQSIVPSTISRYEMLVHRPSSDDPSYSTKQITNVSEAENELEAEADKKDIRCRAMTGYDAIARIVLEAEAA